MRVATLIISLFLMVIVGLQSCTVAVLGGATGDDTTAGAGASGVLLAVCWLVAAAFVLPYPTVAMAVFLVAAVFGLIGTYGNAFTDAYVWTAVSVVLAILSFFGRREKRAKQAVPSFNEGS